MRRRSIKTGFLLASIAAVAVSAEAASLTNKDSDGLVVIVTEDGVRTEIAISGGETVTFCNGGCFVTLPSGAKAALRGSETLEIVNEEAVVR